MRRAAIIAIAAAAVVAAAAAGMFLVRPRDRYHPRAVEFLGEGVTDEGVQLLFKVPEESAQYHCPGARYEIDGASIRYDLVRAAVDAVVDIDVEAVPQDAPRTYKVMFPWDWVKNKSVELVDSTGRTQGKWTMAE